MLKKIMLFISSYIPLYVLMIAKNIMERITENGKFIDVRSKLKNAIFFDECNDYAIVLLSLMCLISLVYLCKVLKSTKGEKSYLIKDLTDETSNYYFNYISIYLLSCLGLTLNSIVDVFVFIFLMIIVGYIYVSNNMIYMNPTINFLGYKVYDAKIDSVNTKDKEIQSIIISKSNIKLKINDKILGTGKNGFIFTKNKVS